MRALIAVFLAVSLDPVVRLLIRWHFRRRLAILLVVLVAAGLVAAFLQSVILAMLGQFVAMAKDFLPLLASLQGRSASFRRISDRFHLTSQIRSVLAGLPGGLSSGLFGVTGLLFSALGSTLSVAVLTADDHPGEVQEEPLR
jgi:predicted PurR-regulated permease PerM